MDKGRFEEIRRLRDEYESALDEAEARRADYHLAIQRLHRSGMPLREIAEGLGISHQRVHQIVSGESPKKRSRAARATLAASVVMVVGAGGFFTVQLVGRGGRVETAGSPTPAGRQGDVLDCQLGANSIAVDATPLPSSPASERIAALGELGPPSTPTSIVVLVPATGEVVAVAGGPNLVNRDGGPDLIVRVSCVASRSHGSLRLEDRLQGDPNAGVPRR